MTLRQKFVLYLIILHLVFLALVPVEKSSSSGDIEVFIMVSISFIVGVGLVRYLIVPQDLIRGGMQLLSQRDFSCRFVEVGQPELDQLIRVYKRMTDCLRDERTRLQEQQDFTEKMVAASPSGIMTLDFRGRVAMVNSSTEQMLQMTAAELMGRKLDEVGSSFLDALSRLGVGESQVVPLWGRRWVKCYRSQFMDQGSPRSFILMQELTEELRRSEKEAYEKLIRVVSHEVNNSIGAANSLLHSCLHYKDQIREEDREDFETALSVAISRTDHLSAFTKSFADVVRLPQPELRPVDLKALIEDVELLMTAESRNRGIEWTWDIQQPLAHVQVDKNQMEQVFVNVLKNSMEAIGQDGRMTIRMGKRNGRGFVVIEDTGCGIAPEVRADLFTPFFSTKEDGQGIGLTMVQEILGRHGCEFSLEAPPGEPTQFTIYFR